MIHNLFKILDFFMFQKLTRRISSHLMNIYVPTSVLVMISWISFFIPTEIVPGRMALLVTIFLMLVNISNAAHSSGPAVAGFTAMDIWLVISMWFVALTLLEYACLLRMRYMNRFAKVRQKNQKRELKNKAGEACIILSKVKVFIYIKTCQIYLYPLISK